MDETTSILILIFGSLFFTLFAFFIVLSVALNKKKQYQHYIEKQEMQHHFENELMNSRLEVQEQTLKHLSAELHDNIAQVLGIAKMTLHELNRNITGDAKKSVNLSAEIVGKAIQDIRDMSRVMNGSYVLKSGLVDSIKKDLSYISSAKRINCIFNEEGTAYDLGEDRELLIFRIIQESLANAVRHGKPDKINVSLVYADKALQVEIADNGRGFDTIEQNNNGGLGLANIAERIKLLNGKIHIDSAIDQGTKVQLYIPCP